MDQLPSGLNSQLDSQTINKPLSFSIQKKTPRNLRKILEPVKAAPGLKECVNGLSGINGFKSRGLGSGSQNYKIQRLPVYRPTEGLLILSKDPLPLPQQEKREKHPLKKTKNSFLDSISPKIIESPKFLGKKYDQPTMTRKHHHKKSGEWISKTISRNPSSKNFNIYSKSDKPLPFKVPLGLTPNSSTRSIGSQMNLSLLQISRKIKESLEPSPILVHKLPEISQQKMETQFKQQTKKLIGKSNQN